MLRWVCTAAMLTVCALAWGEEKDFHDQDLTNHSFVGESLNRANFSKAVLDNANFTNASIKKANFKGTILTRASFYKADASEADFRGATTTNGIWFSETKLNNANLEGVKLILNPKCTLKDAKLKKAKISSVYQDCDLSGADLRGANLRAAFHAGNANSIPRFTDALYDEDTAWPDGFDPKAAGLILKEADKAEEKEEDKKEDKK